MILFDEFQHFAGLIAAGTSHAVAVLDRAGAVAAEFEFGEFGWREFQERLGAYPGVAVAAEALEGHVMDQLLLRGIEFFPVAPANMSAHLDRAGQPEGENLPVEARVLAEALRTFGRGWKPLTPQDPLLVHFRWFWSGEKDAKRRTGEMAARLREVLERAFPEVLPVFDGSDPAGWDLVERYPGAAALRRSDRRELEKFLRERGWLETVDGDRCRALWQEVRGKPAGLPRSHEREERLREAVKMLREASELASKFQFQSAAVLQHHPDFACFGSPPAAGTAAD